MKTRLRREMFNPYTPTYLSKCFNIVRNRYIKSKETVPLPVNEIMHIIKRIITYYSFFSLVNKFLSFGLPMRSHISGILVCLFLEF